MMSSDHRPGLWSSVPSRAWKCEAAKETFFAVPLLYVAPIGANNILF